MLSKNPFNSQEALEYSSYSTVVKTGYKSPINDNAPDEPELAQTANLIRAFILEKKHPCIIARASVRSGNCHFGLYPALGSPEATAGLSRDLATFLEARASGKNPYATFMAVFKLPLQQGEKSFEKALWLQLELLHQASEEYYAWDPETSTNPADATFGYSFGGKAFYVVGMHPGSSRTSRQFAYPMLVFNLHEQFQSLRARGSYDKVKSVVRRNDLKLQGTLNPMLRDFGEASEARQYSGRAVSDHWKCPFLANQTLPIYEPSEK